MPFWIAQTQFNPCSFSLPLLWSVLKAKRAFEEHYEVNIKLTFDLSDMKCHLFLTYLTYVSDLVIINRWILEPWAKRFCEVTVTVTFDP